MRETFPKKSPGDYIQAEHLNNLSRVARRVAGQGGGSFQSSYDGQVATAPPFVQRVMIVTGIFYETDDDDIESLDSSFSSFSSSSHVSDFQSIESEGTYEKVHYEVKPRYWDSTTRTWATITDEGPYDLDASEFGDCLQIGDIVTAWWDANRSAYIGAKVQKLSYYNGDPTNNGIPAYGIAIVAGGHVLNDAAIPEVRRPTFYGCQRNFIVNGQSIVRYGEIGVAQNGPYYRALYDKADGIPLVGDQWGPRNGSYKLRAETGGFRILEVVDADAGIALVYSEPFVRFKGEAITAITKLLTSTVKIFYGEAAGTDTGQTMPEVYNDFGDIRAGAALEVVWEGDFAGEMWKITQAECQP